MASLSIVVSTFCQGSQGYVALESVSDAPGADAGSDSYTWTVLNQASGQDYGNGDYCQAGSQVAVPDGQYLVRVFATYANGTRASSAPRPATVSCGAGGTGGGGAAGLAIDSLTHTDAPSAGGTGTVTVKASGGRAPLYATLGLGAAQPIQAGVAFTFPPVAPGTYLVDVYDSTTPTNAYVRATVTVAVHPVLGCTDPLATNPTPGATADDGSCQYSPPAPVPPYLAVPLLQALRFVVRGQGGGVDSTLFCEQPRPGQQVRPYFFQQVESSDPVRVQVLTSYAAVTATIRQHTSGQVVGSPVALQQVLTLEGPVAPLAVLLTQDVATGLTRLAPAQGTELPASLLGSPRLTLAGGATGTYRLTQVVPGSVLALADYVVLGRPWAAPGAGAVTASWLVSGAGFNVWEADLPISSLAAGTYQVQLRATRAGLPDVVADSEPFAVRAQWSDTVAVDFTNADNCYRTVFSTGFVPRLRVKATLFRQNNGGTVTSYDDSAATTAVLASTATRVLIFETYGLPAWLHEKLFLACRLDALRLDGVAYTAPAAYAYELPRAYPLGGGHVDLQQVEFLGAGNGDDAGLPLAGAPANALQLSGGEYVLLHG